MAFINEKPSALSVVAGIGTFVGLLLLGLAGVSVVSSNTPVLKGAINEVLPRRLQYSMVMGYITTTALPSSFDSSDSSSLGSSFEPSKSVDSLSSGSLPSLDIRVAWGQILGMTGSIWLSVTITLVVQSLFACIYFKYVVQQFFGDDTINSEFQKQRPMASYAFNYKMLDCFSNKSVFCSGLLCPMVRQAHTNQVSGVCGFWESLCCWCCCSWVSLGLGPSVLVVFWRTSIQTQMQIPPGENIVEDFCLSCLCPQLSVCQMARSVDEAMGSKQTGCLNFEMTEDIYNNSYNP